MASTKVAPPNGQINEPDEETPLLPAPVATSQSNEDAVREGSQTGTGRDTDDRPLPLRQIFLLCYVRLVEAVSFFSIFPFVNQMIQLNGSLPEEDVGFYSGLIESLFSLTQTFVMLFWGRMADRIGRKPVLVISLFGMAVTLSLFGFARTIWQMILFRCLAGAFAGSAVTVRTMITELSTTKTQARAFSFYAFAGNLGIFMGPLLGGALADPAGQYHGIFSNVQFFKSFPYALSTLATGFLCLVSAVSSLLFVTETKPKAKPSSDPSSTPQEPMSTRSLLRSPGVAIVLYLSGLVLLLGFAFSALLPLFLFTTIEKGGFGFTPIQISLALGLTGFSQAIWLLFVFPPLHSRFGTGGVLKICGRIHPFLFLIVPLLSLLLRRATSNGEHSATGSSNPLIVVFWIVTPLFLALGVGVSMGFTAIQLAINDIAPGMETMGTLNALSLMLSSANRAVTPWGLTALFAVSVRSQLLSGYLVWIVIAAIGFIYTVALQWLPEKAAGVPIHRKKKNRINGHVNEEN